MNSQEEIERIQQVYNTTYRPDPKDRTYLWHPLNPVSVYYRQAQERAMSALFNDCHLPVEEFSVLDVGCGSGNLLRFFASLGVLPERLYGIDLMPYRVEQAQRLCPPQTNLRVGDAGALPFPAANFDIVCQFTVFSSIFDIQLRTKVAGEMLRVLKPGGKILWYDMRGGQTATTLGIEAPEIRTLFPGCAIITLRGVHPPRASQIVRRSRLLVELWDYISGPKKTHYLALLQKP